MRRQVAQDEPQGRRDERADRGSAHELQGDHRVVVASERRHSEDRAKIALAHKRKRRAPNTVVSHAAAGATTIWPAENTEVSQEPSSKPRPGRP
jgi:hypothetical protein